MTSRQCKNDPNKFCYICDELTFAKEKRSITSHIKKLYMYKAYFHCDIGDQEKTWVSQVCCLICVKTLSAWCWKQKHDPFFFFFFFFFFLLSCDHMAH